MTVEDYWRQVQARVGVPLTGECTEATLQAIRRELGLWGQPFPEVDERVEAEAEAVKAALERPVRKHFPEVWRRSPNYSGTLTAAGVCFHHSDGSLKSNLDWLVEKASISRASYHCIIDLDGTRTRLVDDRRRAWHAGFGKWKGLNPNHHLIGVSFTGNTRTGEHRLGWQKLTVEELESALEFLEQRWEPMGFELGTMTHHRAVDPGRRDDLPDRVWNQLYAAIEAAFGGEARG